MFFYRVCVFTADCTYHNLDVDDLELKVLPAVAKTIVGTMTLLEIELSERLMFFLFVSCRLQADCDCPGVAQSPLSRHGRLVFFLHVQEPALHLQKTRRVHPLHHWYSLVAQL